MQNSSVEYNWNEETGQNIWRNNVSNKRMLNNKKDKSWRGIMKKIL